MLPDIRVTDWILVPGSELESSFVASGGPGGQNVNKVASKAIVRWNPGRSEALPPGVKARLLASAASKLTTEGDLIVTSQKTRDQGRNVEDCLEKIRAMVLAAATPPKPRRATRPTKASKERRLENKGRRAETKRLRRKVDD